MFNGTAQHAQGEALSNHLSPEMAVDQISDLFPKLGVVTRVIFDLAEDEPADSPLADTLQGVALLLDGFAREGRVAFAATGLEMGSVILPRDVVCTLAEAADPRTSEHAGCVRQAAAELSSMGGVVPLRQAMVRLLMKDAWDRARGPESRSAVHPMALVNALKEVMRSGSAPRHEPARVAEGPTS